MTKRRAIAVLRQHNAWRRGKNDDQPNPREIGLAIDKAVEVMSGKKAKNR